MIENILETSKEYGLVGFVLFLMFAQGLVFLRVIYMLFVRMTDALEKSASAMSQLSTNIAGTGTGRRGRR